MIETSGELEADAAWDGDVRLLGDVVVPAGRTLRVRAGTRLSFAERPRWSCAVFRGAPEGYPIEASSRRTCDLVVLGRLEVEGDWERSVEAVGVWGGITLLGAARASLRGARLSCSGEHGIQTFDDASLELEDVRIEGPKVGVLAWGVSAVRAARTVLAASESGVLVREGARAQLDRVRFSGGVDGILAQHWALVDASRCHFRGCRRAGVAAFDRSGVTARLCAFEDCDQGVLVGSWAEARVEESRFHANRVGLQTIESARIAAAGCEVAASREQGAKISQRSSAVVRECRFEGNALAGVYSEDESSVEVTRCELADETPVANAGAGRLVSSGNVMTEERP